MHVFKIHIVVFGRRAASVADLAERLRDHSHVILVARSLHEATRTASTEGAVLAIACDGRTRADLELVKEARRAWRDVPLVVCPPAYDERSFLAALEAGADACGSVETPALVKAQCRAILRRARTMKPWRSGTRDPLAPLPGVLAQHVRPGVYLSAFDLAFLTKLASRPGSVVPARALAGMAPSANAFRVAVYRLRRKVPHLQIRSVPGGGYILDPPPAPARSRRSG